ncbi:cell wall metabolism sensor histidine kinase WalK [Planomonospora sp. ID82291]|uniref:sensor histidine kinase n=1 Tax=Planomonospora sp. ID82291 TaxID=2738136 RepID=UPI0018C3D141|nr:HAMP domain-containing sensor histidine kinase [Planomonospora sp. ID82291]MBG0816494.1 HAMP domain-containing histidine kinase [Planomonospora sp. ID82291]
MTLRVRLLLLMVALTALALTVTGAASVFALRSHLVGRIDDQLQGAASIARQSPLLAGADRVELLRTAIAPTEYLVELRREDGVITGTAFTGGLRPGALLERAPVPPAGGSSAPETIDTGAAGRYRTVSFTGPGGRVRAVVALPLQPVRDAVVRLLLVESLTALAVLLVLSSAARLSIIRGLRPLDRIADTAGAIADGDLSRRVPETSPRTEAGRLAQAVNGMLARIESALSARARSEERLRRFVADASHELRTPLTSVRGYLQLLRQGIVTPEGRPDAVRRADEEAARMAKIIDGLLYLARLDQEPRLQPGPVDLRRVAADSVADALTVEPDRPITLDAPAVCTLVADEDAVRQILANLLGNVRAHTPPRTPARIVLRTSADGAVIEVVDRGPGMGPEALDRAFDRFYRVAPAGRGGSSGSGLGLPIVAAIAHAHGGSARIRSAPGEGTAVEVGLPSQPPSGSFSPS